MTNSHADLLIWLGGLGVVEFGLLLLAVRYVDRSVLGARWRTVLLMSASRRHVERGLRIAPALLILSAASVIAGAVLRFMVAS
jgi:hypothetical protein